MEISIKGTESKEMFKDRLSSFEASFKNTFLEHGKLGFATSVEEEAYKQTVEEHPLYSKHKNVLDKFKTHGFSFYNVGSSNIYRARYEKAIENNLFALDEEDNLIESEGNTGVSFLYDDEIMKGYLIAKKYGIDITPKYKEITQKEQKEISEAQQGLFGSIMGTVAGYILQPEMIPEIALSPAYIGGKTVLKAGAKAFGTEALAIGVGEVMREDKRRRHKALLGDDKSLIDSATDIIINSAIGGAIRGVGSAIYDTALLKSIKDTLPSANEKEIMEEFIRLQDSKLSTKHHEELLNKALEDIESDKKVDISQGTDIDIDTKTDPSIEKVSLEDEVSKQPEFKQDSEFLEKYNKSIDEQTKIKFDYRKRKEPISQDNIERIKKYQNDSRMTQDPETARIIKEMSKLQEGDK